MGELQRAVEGIWCSNAFLSEGRKLRPDHMASASGSNTSIVQRGQWALLSDFTPVACSPAGIIGVPTVNGPAAAPGDRGLMCDLSQTGLLCRGRKNSGSGNACACHRGALFAWPCAGLVGTDEPAPSLEKLALTES